MREKGGVRDNRREERGEGKGKRAAKRGDYTSDAIDERPGRARATGTPGAWASEAGRDAKRGLAIRRRCQEKADREPLGQTREAQVREREGRD